jgi:hypothetical protein
MRCGSVFLLNIEHTHTHHTHTHTHTTHTHTHTPHTYTHHTHTHTHTQPTLWPLYCSTHALYSKCRTLAYISKLLND